MNGKGRLKTLIMYLGMYLPITTGSLLFRILIISKTITQAFFFIAS